MVGVEEEEEDGPKDAGDKTLLSGRVADQDCATCPPMTFASSCIPFSFRVIKITEETRLSDARS